MDINELRVMIREVVEEAMYPCHFLVSYDIHESNDALKSKLPEKLKELMGCMKNESLYCFSGGDRSMAKVVRALETLMNEEKKSVNETIIYCISAQDNKLWFHRIEPNS